MGYYSVRAGAEFCDIGSMNTNSHPSKTGPSKSLEVYPLLQGQTSPEYVVAFAITYSIYIKFTAQHYNTIALVTVNPLCESQILTRRRRMPGGRSILCLLYIHHKRPARAMSREGTSSAYSWGSGMVCRGLRVQDRALGGGSNED